MLIREIMPVDRYLSLMADAYAATLLPPLATLDCR